jgi:hypothetical protein
MPSTTLPRPAPLAPAATTLSRHYNNAAALAYAHGFTGFGHAIRCLNAHLLGLPQPPAPAPRPSYMPEPGTPAGNALAAYYDRPGYKGD